MNSKFIILHGTCLFIFFLWTFLKPVFIGITKEIALDFARRLGMGGEQREDAADIFIKLYNMFIANDCTLLEINPFTENADGAGL